MIIVKFASSWENKISFEVSLTLEGGGNLEEAVSVFLTCYLGADEFSHVVTWGGNATNYFTCQTKAYKLGLSGLEI